VLTPFNLTTSDGEVKKVVVDIVCDRGQTWVKVIARSAKSLNLNSHGGNQFGQKSFISQVQEFVLCASQNEVLFEPPTVKILFAYGVTSNLYHKIKRKGAEVVGEIVSVNDDEYIDEDETSDEESDFSDLETDVVDLKDSDNCESIDNSKVNLDITAMIAYISALTNGRNNFEFKEKILSEQASWEKKSPVKPFLDSVFENKELVCCASAMKDFQSIVNTLGGPGERVRAAELTKRITIVPDTESPRTLTLENSAKIKERSRNIFGTGDALKILTVTANTGFLRAAKGQGISFAVITHESRALTEDKEKFAVRVEGV